MFKLTHASDTSYDLNREHRQTHTFVQPVTCVCRKSPLTFIQIRWCTRIEKPVEISRICHHDCFIAPCTRCEGVLTTTFLVLVFIHRLFLKNLNRSWNLKETTIFRRIDRPSSSGKKGETPILMDPADRTIPNLWKRFAWLVFYSTAILKFRPSRVVKRTHNEYFLPATVLLWRRKLEGKAKL
jgi:hypothetical protein